MQAVVGLHQGLHQGLIRAGLFFPPISLQQEDLQAFQRRRPSCKAWSDPWRDADLKAADMCVTQRLPRSLVPLGCVEGLSVPGPLLGALGRVDWRC